MRHVTNSESQRGRMLVCVTRSPHAGSVLRGAVACARAMALDPEFLHVGRDESATREPLVELLAEHGLDTHPLIIREGKPAAVICEAAKQNHADLIFAGALEQDSVVRDLVGSTARNVARRAGCSVFLMTGALPPAGTWMRIVAAVQLDDRFKAMFADACAFARAMEQTTLHVVYEHESFDAHLPGGTASGAGGADMRHLQGAAENFRLANFLEQFDLRGLNLRTAALPSRPGHEAVRHAREMGAELLVVSADDRPLGFWDRFFGHPAEIALQKLPCSVLLHRSRMRPARGAEESAP